MPAFVLEYTPTRPYREIAWYPMAGDGNVLTGLHHQCAVIAWGPELEFIRQRIKGIRDVPGHGSKVSWTGEDALFILMNINPNYVSPNKGVPHV